VVDDPHLGAGVHARQIGQQLELELLVIVQRAHDLGHILGADPDLGRIRLLDEGRAEALAEGGLKSAGELRVRRLLLN
jgi:hypothetical protein